VRYPYERFLRYLVSRKANVNDALERIGLPSVGDLWRPSAVGSLCASAPLHIKRYLNAPRGYPLIREGFLEWAEKQEIDTLWRDQPEFCTSGPSPTIALAGRLFYSPARRAVVGMLLLCGVARDEICQIVKDRFDVEVTESALSLYQWLYWDCRQTSRAFWQDVLPNFSAEERQLYGHGLRWPPPRVDELRQLVGLDADDDPKAALRQMLALANRGLRDAAAAPIPEIQDVFKWMAVVERAATQVQKVVQAQPKEGDAAPDPAAGFNLFSVTVDRLPIPTLAELQGELPEMPGGGGRK
jgi:hypothetical protein